MHAGELQNELTMKRLLSLVALLAVVPFALSAGKVARPRASTVQVSVNNVGGQDCVLINGSGYAANKSVTVDVDGFTSQTFTAPTDGSGNFALYIYQTYTPGYYTVTVYQGSRAATLMATSGFDVP